MTERIRWEDKTPSSGDVYVVAHIGYVGTVEESAFIIYTPDELHDNWLLSVRLTPGSQFLYADSAEALKAEAERWLERFVSSLGAVFPEQETAAAVDTPEVPGEQERPPARGGHRPLGRNEWL